MKKRWIALAMTLLLAAMLPASAQGLLPEGFSVEELMRIYNDQLVQTFMQLYQTDAATKVAQYKSGTAQLEDGALSFGNRDGTVVLRASFPDGVPDTSAPAAGVELFIAGGVDPMDYPTLKTVFAGVIARADGSADLQTLQNWMTGAGKGGETLALNGYTLAHTRDAAGNTFALIPEGKGEAGQEPTIEAGSDSAIEAGPELGEGPDLLAEPEPDPTQVSQAGAGALLSWKGFELTPLRTERWRFSNGRISMRLYLRVVNRTGMKLTLRAEDVTLDGTALPNAYLFDIKKDYDSGADSEDNLLIYPDGDITDRMTQDVLYGREMSMRIVLEDARKHEDLYMEKVELDLSALPDETTVSELSNDPTPAPTPAPTRAPQATKAPTAKPSYQPLFEGDKGEEVRRMQLKLIELGYLNDSADGEFGPKTAAAVREFCQTNGLGSDSYASSAMLERLYSGYATPYQEPWVPLIFPAEARGEWRNAKSDQLYFRAKVTNSSRSHTIRAFELYMYATDVWGDKVYDGTIYYGTIYYGTTTKTLKPGQSAFSDYFLLPNRSRISKVWCGIKKVIFKDGTIRENDTVDYANWTIK